MRNDNRKKRPEWVQLELFPEMKASQGGDQSVTNKTDKAK